MNKSAFVLSIATALPVSAGWAAGLDPVSIAPYQIYPRYSDQLGTFNAPYYALLKDASTAGISVAMARDSRLRFGAALESSTGRDWFSPNFNERNKRYLNSAEFEQKVGRAVGTISVGVLRESGLMLGSLQGRTLGLNANPTTTFTSISAGYALGSNSSLLLRASSGRTAGFGAADSLMWQLSTLRTTSYSVSFASNRVWNNQDRFELTFSVPTRVRSGEIQLSPAAVQFGTINALGYAPQSLNLRPTATERDLEMSYSTMFGKDGRLGKVTGGVMWRINPGHDASARPDWMLGMRYGVGF
jgi:hypothetical protein